MQKHVQILLVEDDNVDIMAFERAYKSRNLEFPLTIARDGQEGLEQLRAMGPGHTTVLLDLNLPRMNGLEFLEAIRSDGQLAKTTVFMLTTSARPEDIERAHSHHVAGYILKQNVGPRYSLLFDLLQQFWALTEAPPELQRAPTPPWDPPPHSLARFSTDAT